MTTPSGSHHDAFDDEAYASDMREYWGWAATQPDPIEYLVILAEDRDLGRMEAEGIAAAEPLVQRKR